VHHDPVAGGGDAAEPARVLNRGDLADEDVAARLPEMSVNVSPASVDMNMWPVPSLLTSSLTAPGGAQWPL
jgi:hypothetical protein